MIVYSQDEVKNSARPDQTALNQSKDVNHFSIYSSALYVCLFFFLFLFFCFFFVLGLFVCLFFHCFLQKIAISNLLEHIQHVLHNGSQ